jgi:ketosteroid isomerase-like protein
MDDTRLRLLEDRLDLVDLVHRYAQVIDFAQSEEEILSVFTEDVMLQGPFRGIAQGTQALSEYANSVIEMRKTTPFRHDVTNIQVKLDGDEARIDALFSLVYRYSIYEGRAELKKQFLGSFECDARRTADGWRLSKRIVHLELG